MSSGTGRSLDEQVAAIVVQYRVDKIGAWGDALRLSADLTGPDLWPVCHRLLASADPAERYVGLVLLNGPPDDDPEHALALRIAALDDQDGDVVDEALGAIGRRDTPAALPALERVVRRWTGDNRLTAVDVLSESPSIAEQVLIRVAGDADLAVRRRSVGALATGVDSVTPELIEILDAASRDPDEQVRGHALAGLAARHDDRAADRISAELARGPSGPWALEAAELSADPSLLPALGRLNETSPDLVSSYRDQADAARDACQGTAWTRHPRPSRRRPPHEPISEAERAALIARSPHAPSTSVWLRDQDIERVWLVDLTTLERQRFTWRDSPAWEDVLQRTAGIAVHARWGGMVAIYRIGAHHRLIIGSHRFDLDRPRDVAHHCRSIYSTITAEQDSVHAQARRIELNWLPEALGLGDPMITDHEPFGSWYEFHHIAALANQLPDHTAGPYVYRRDASHLVQPS